jgi:putative oxidoreductase
MTAVTAPRAAAADSVATNWSPRVLSILRIVIGFLYICHGTQKFFGFPGGNPQPLDLMTLRGLSAILELFGGALICAGLFTRPVAFILSGHMAFAYFIAHAAQSFWPIVNRGELSIMFCFTFLYLAAAGGGPWSLDAAFRGPPRR